MNERQKKILQIMYESADFMTADTIAEQVKCSVKTVRNDLKQLQDMFANNDLAEIQTKSGKGIRLIVSQEKWKELKCSFEKTKEISGISRDVRNQICEILLKQERVTINYLENTLYYSSQSLEKYLQESEQWLKSKGVEVSRKRGQGLQIRCEESVYRIAVWENFRELLAERFYTDKEVLLLLEKYLDGFDTEGVKTAIRMIEDEFGVQFTYDDFQRLLFLLSISILRIRKKRVLNKIVEESWEGVSFDRTLMEHCSRNLEEFYCLRIPKEEKSFICLCFGITEIQGFTDIYQKETCRQANAFTMMLTIKSMILVDHIFQSELRKDIQLRDELFLYLKAAICQRKYGIYRGNPLLSQIKSKYPNIYAAAWSVSMLIDSELKVGFSEQEVGYIALYLGGALERQSMEVRACVLCNYGVGMAQIIKGQIERNVYGLEITDVFSVRQRNEIRKSSTDFVISTVPVENSFEGKEMVLVNSILREEDFLKIRKQMEGISKKKHYRMVAKDSLSEYRLFYPEFVFEYQKEIKKDALIHQMCQKLFENGYITKDFENSVFEREKMTATELEKMVAIPHGMAEHVIRPVIAVAKLEKPIQWNKYEKVDYIFLLAVNLKDEFGARKQIAGFYKKLVALLGDEKQYFELKQVTGAIRIARFLNELIES